MSDPDCLLCHAERVTEWHLEDDDCWIADCVVCMTPMIVWRTHGLPDADLEAALLDRLGTIAAARYGAEGYYVDGERRRIPTTGTRTLGRWVGSSIRRASCSDVSDRFRPIQHPSRPGYQCATPEAQGLTASQDASVRSCERSSTYGHGSSMTASVSEPP